MFSEDDRQSREDVSQIAQIASTVCEWAPYEATSFYFFF